MLLLDKRIIELYNLWPNLKNTQFGFYLAVNRLKTIKTKIILFDA